MAQKNQVLKGFLMGIADYAQNKANETKLKAQLALNAAHERENWLWKLQTEMAQRKAQNQATIDLVNKMRSQGMGDEQDSGGFDINAPEARIGSEGKIDVYYPSEADRKFKIKQTWAQIDRKQARNLPLNNLEKSFMETYPKEAWLESKNIASPEGLTVEQQINARTLARKLYGVKGAEFGLPAIYEGMRSGKSIDQIEDDVRYASQSKEFVGPVREAAQSILINTSADKAQTSMDYIDDMVQKGNVEGAKQQLKRLARAQSGVDDQRTIQGKERTVKLMDEIQDDLNKLESAGVNTNIFTGTAEQVAAKVGTVKNPELRKVATKISAAVQNYRRSMTGVQFGMPENKEYQLMFPQIGRTANFNTANINALREVMQGDLDNFLLPDHGRGKLSKVIWGWREKSKSR
jgi:hypothetical protein